MNEADLKNQLVKVIRSHFPDWVVIRHEERRGGNSGVPDISVTGGGLTSWWEVKHADPDFESRGIQELMMQRLYVLGRAYYIVYETTSGDKVTRIVPPIHLKQWRTAPGWEGYNHIAICAFIRNVHYGMIRRPHE